MESKPFVAAPLLDNDVDNLFFQSGMFFGVSNYSEFVRERTARNAASRWPLLVEVYGLDTSVNEKGDE